MKKHDFIVGVPCSSLKPEIKKIKKYIPSTREDEAVAMAFGAHLVGKKSLVFLQNSGLGNTVDVITTLLKPYGVEIDLLISLRNKPEHHAFMGKVTIPILNLLEYKKYKVVGQCKE